MVLCKSQIISHLPKSEEWTSMVSRSVPAPIMRIIQHVHQRKSFVMAECAMSDAILSSGSSWLTSLCGEPQLLRGNDRRGREEGFLLPFFIRLSISPRLPLNQKVLVGRGRTMHPEYLYNELATYVLIGICVRQYQCEVEHPGMLAGLGVRLVVTRNCRATISVTTELSQVVNAIIPLHIGTYEVRCGPRSSRFVP